MTKLGAYREFKGGNFFETQCRFSIYKSITKTTKDFVWSGIGGGPLYVYSG